MNDGERLGAMRCKTTLGRTDRLAGETETDSRASRRRPHALRASATRPARDATGDGRVSGMASGRPGIIMTRDRTRGCHHLELLWPVHPDQGTFLIPEDQKTLAEG